MMNLEAIQSIATGAGSALVLGLVIINALWKKLAEKDIQLKALSDSVTHAYIENTKAMTQFRDTIEKVNKSMDENTKKVDTLTDRFNFAVNMKNNNVSQNT